MNGTKEMRKNLYGYVTIPMDEYESMKRTIDVLSDKELMEQIRESKTAKSKPWKSIKKELGL